MNRCSPDLHHAPIQYHLSGELDEFLESQVGEGERFDSKSKAVNHYIECGREADALEAEVNRLRDRLDSREERIATLEEQLPGGRRSRSASTTWRLRSGRTAGRATPRFSSAGIGGISNATINRKWQWYRGASPFGVWVDRSSSNPPMAWASTVNVIRGCTALCGARQPSRAK